MSIIADQNSPSSPSHQQSTTTLLHLSPSNTHHSPTTASTLCNNEQPPSIPQSPSHNHQPPTIALTECNNQQPITILSTPLLLSNNPLTPNNHDPALNDSIQILMQHPFTHQDSNLLPGRASLGSLNFSDSNFSHRSHNFFANHSKHHKFANSGIAGQSKKDHEKH